METAPPTCERQAALHLHLLRQDGTAADGILPWSMGVQHLDAEPLRARGSPDRERRRLMLSMAVGSTAWKS